MTSRMTLSSKSLIRNPQRHPSTPLLDPPSWHTSNEDINTKLSGYLPGGKIRSSMTSRMTLSSKSLVRNPQRPPSTPFWPPIPDTLLIKISTRNFQGIFLRVKQGHPGYQGWPCPPSFLSGTINVLQVPSFWTPHSWHTSNKDINTKLSDYLP